MRLRFIFIFLTFVLTPVGLIAAPQKNHTLPPIGSEEEAPSEKVDMEEANLTLSEPPPPIKTKTLYYPYSQSISPRVGLFLDVKEFNDTKATFYILGFNYLLPHLTSPAIEVTADLTSNSKGLITGSYRWIFNERSGFRPFYKAGLTLKTQAFEQLATFTNHENFMARGSIGMEDLLKNPMSTRLELELAIGSKDVFAFISLGYSWGW